MAGNGGRSRLVKLLKKKKKKAVEVNPNRIMATFMDGCFHVSYNIRSKQFPRRLYDRIEISEVTSYHHITTAVSVTNSTISRGALLLKPLALLGLGEGKYYAVFISADTGEKNSFDQEIARSEIFTIDPAEVSTVNNAKNLIGRRKTFEGQLL